MSSCQIHTGKNRRKDSFLFFCGNISHVGEIDQCFDFPPVALYSCVFLRLTAKHFDCSSENICLLEDCKKMLFARLLFFLQLHFSLTRLLISLCGVFYFSFISQKPLKNRLRGIHFKKPYLWHLWTVTSCQICVCECVCEWNMKTQITWWGTVQTFRLFVIFLLNYSVFQNNLRQCFRL